MVKHDSKSSELHRAKHGEEFDIRMDRLPGHVRVNDPGGHLHETGTLIGVASSRLGHDESLHQMVGRFLSRTVLDARIRNATLLIASGTAIEPWAVRAVELFGVDWIRLRVEGEHPSSTKSSIADSFLGEIILGSTHQGTLDRDDLLIQLADRLEVVHVRRGGKIAKSVTSRLEHSQCRHDVGSVRVALFGHLQCGALELIQQGAVGWYSPKLDATERSNEPSNERSPTRWRACQAGEDWLSDSEEWMVHCTRATRGPWPGQTPSQYRDEMLLGSCVRAKRTPLETLDRILRSDRLLASSVATVKSHPVVCFSQRSLLEILLMRRFRPHLGRWDYEPFGIAIRKEIAISIGIEPVLYGQPSDRRRTRQQDLYRFHPVGKTFDWRIEQEWRSATTVMLDQLPKDSIRVFAPDSEQARLRLGNCRYPITWLVPEESVAVPEAF